MNFEKIEQAFSLMLENTQLLENRIKTNFYDALIEQNSFYLNGGEPDEQIESNNQKLRELSLDKEEWRKTYQFLFIKASQTEKLQANHQFTPDALAFIILFLMEELTTQDTLDVLEIGSGTGNLAETLLNHSQKHLNYTGIEIDELLIDLSASIADVIGAKIQFIEEDAVRPQLLKEKDVVLSDLPVGFYPDDTIAERYKVSSSSEHTYAHHLLMEQSLKYLKKDGYAFFLAPTNLLNSPQSNLLKSWLKNYARVAAVISFPESLFGNRQNMKSLFVLQKKSESHSETFVYHLSDLQNQENLQTFMKNVKKWRAHK